jgi:hypothetical protein
VQAQGPDTGRAATQELTSLFLKATELFLDFRSAEVGSAVFDKVTTAVVISSTRKIQLYAASHHEPTSTELSSAAATCAPLPDNTGPDVGRHTGQLLAEGPAALDICLVTECMVKQHGHVLVCTPWNPEPAEVYCRRTTWRWTL